MNFYQEITLIDHAEISPYVIWSKLYQQIHIALAEHKNNDQKVPFGMSFPEYQYDLSKGHNGLGKKLRVFAKTREELMILNLGQWLERLSDYVHIQSIKPVPDKVSGYAIYKRKQIKGDSRVQKDRIRFATSYAQRNHVELNEAMALYQNMKMQEIYLPYIQMLSLTNEQRFKLFIEKQMIESKSSDQMFTTYGLSVSASVPEF